jgi:hypothetical protein
MTGQAIPSSQYGIARTGRSEQDYLQVIFTISYHQFQLGFYVWNRDLQYFDLTRRRTKEKEPDPKY